MLLLSKLFAGDATPRGRAPCMASCSERLSFGIPQLSLGCPDGPDFPHPALIHASPHHMFAPNGDSERRRDAPQAALFRMWAATESRKLSYDSIEG
jgi:hypothetical protein